MWTDWLLPGFRPAGKGFMVGGLLLEPDGNGGTRYTAIARHADPESAAQHAAMGFHHGWGAALDQSWSSPGPGSAAHADRRRDRAPRRRRCLGLPSVHPGREGGPCPRTA